MLAIPLCVAYINTMTTRLNNSMIMVHIIRSLLTNLNSMIAIEAKYVELCKYTVAYVGLITSFLHRSSAVECPVSKVAQLTAPGGEYRTELSVFSVFTCRYFGIFGI